MKLLEVGKNSKEEWKLVTECTGHGNSENKGCNSKLEVEFEDLRFYEGREFPWRIESDAVCFKCPVCEEITDLKKEEWPNDMKGITAWSSSWHYGDSRK